ncbi:MAG: MBL fold metallo-hydrolase, partial [Oscillospiraceae bacterium]|nr:MBL fold metallo-hydrolase [Oscillospiraceae bacterium]
EPAVSYYIELDGLRILFDTGYSDVFLKNAAALGIGLSRLTHIVLSHGHNDHTNGLSLLRQQYDLSQVRLVAHPRCFAPRWADGAYIGPPCTEEEAGAFCTCQPSAGPHFLSENCAFLGEIPALHGFESRVPIGWARAGGQLVPDLLPDDSALACKTAEGLFIVTGCSHSGICNIISYARQVLGEERVAGIVGGFHLFRRDDRLRQTAAFLREVSPRRLYPCHCVSLAAKVELMRHLDVEEVGSGMLIEL